MIKQSIENDIKTAMLAGDKELVSVLRTVKSAILDVEVNQNLRDTGLTDDAVITLLQKESKKRGEAAKLYDDAGDQSRAGKERAEQEIIQKYLPAMMSEEEIAAIIDETVSATDNPSMQKMGQIIGAVKAKTGNLADGSMIAQLVKARLNS